MDIITTSLEALIQRATSVNNQGADTAAIDAFCGLINKEPDCALTATKFISAKLHSLHEWEALQALLVLEKCMKKCGPAFHAEVGKFRFLNELIKLVSPKYSGDHTPEGVRKRVLELMYLWTVHYPHEMKIKEAYEMLKKQGVVKDDAPPAPPPPKEPNRSAPSILQDEEKSQLLQKLLQSKDPEDLQAANRLIKSMVREDEKRIEEKWRHAVELETVVNNCRLLNEMLDCYEKGVSSDQDFELIKELHGTCLNFRPLLFKFANSSNNDPMFCNTVLAANDELGEVFTKYNNFVQNINSPSVKKESKEKSAVNEVSSLLDLSSTSPSTATSSQIMDEAVKEFSELGLNVAKPALVPPATPNNVPVQQSSTNYLSALDDIFSAPPTSQINVPSTFLPQPPAKTETPSKVVPAKNKGLEELDLLGESLLKESLNAFKKPENLQPATEVAKPPTESGASSLLDDDLLLEPDSVPLSSEKAPPPPLKKPELTPVVNSAPVEPKPSKEETKFTVLPLGDLSLSINDIKPSSIPPFQALEEKNGISTVIHLAKDCPRPDVSVFVVTTCNSNQFPISQFLFQPVVPKTCRLRLLPPSATSLPARNPFLLPTTITQVMLIASPSKDPISLKFVASYVMEDETCTEMGEVEKLLLAE